MATKNVHSPDGRLAYYLEDGEHGFNMRTNPRWQEWLKQGEAFIVQTLHSGGYVETGYTARCEQAKDRKAHRWYGYKRRDGRLVKRYLGRSQDLTWEVLQEALNRFT